jgi:hypothetical protein
VQDYFRSPGYIHFTLLTGLAFDTIYYYQFGNELDGWSEVRQFTSRSGTFPCIISSHTAQS